MLLYFCKAFDKVNHLKLLYKTRVHGVQGKTLGWIESLTESFLVGRSQSVVLDGERSDELPVLSVVPQGSVVGLILFSRYIKDLAKHLQSQARLFTDDTAVYLTVHSSNDSEKLQRNLNMLQEWEVKRDMELNPAKCQVLYVIRTRNPIRNNYTTHGQTLESVKNAFDISETLIQVVSRCRHILGS